MITVYEARLSVPLDKALGLIRKAAPEATAIIVRKELGSGPLLYFSLFLSLKALQEGRNRARTLELEWLCRLSCCGNVSSALKATAPVPGETAVIATTIAFGPGLQEQLGVLGVIESGEGKGGRKGEDDVFLKDFYKLTDEALSEYSVPDLAMEKMAVEAAR